LAKDSGCSQHVTGNLHALDNYRSHPKESEVTVANGERLRITGYRDVTLKSTGGIMMTLSNVPFVPGLSYNLVSVSQLAAEGYGAHFVNNESTLFWTNPDRSLEPVCFGALEDNLFKIDVYAAHYKFSMIFSINKKDSSYITMSTYIQWHKRLAH
jgi:hypothetical protein